MVSCPKNIAFEQPILSTARMTNQRGGNGSYLKPTSCNKVIGLLNTIWRKNANGSVFTEFDSFLKVPGLESLPVLSESKRGGIVFSDNGDFAFGRNFVLHSEAPVAGIHQESSKAFA